MPETGNRTGAGGEIFRQVQSNNQRANSQRAGGARLRRWPAVGPGWVVLPAVCGALGLLLAACASPDQPEPATAVPAPEATRGPSIRIYPLGQTARGEAGEVTIHGVRLSEGAGVDAPPAGYRWMLFDVGVRNTGPEPAAFHARLEDIYSVDVERAHPPGVLRDLDSPIAAGADVRGEIAFLVRGNGAGGTLLYGLGEHLWALQLGVIRGID